jgi:hypothetical protein
LATNPDGFIIHRLQNEGGNMKKFQIFGLVFASTALVFSMALADRGNGNKPSGEVRINLSASSAFPSAKGYAKFKNRGGEREFEVELEHLRQLSNQRLGVCLNGSRVGSLKINSLGRGELNLNSDSGEKVPSVGANTKVQVHTNNSCSAALVASGQF